MEWRSIQEDEYADIATQLLNEVLLPNSTHATVLALSGTLGAGKTTFARALARALGIAQHIKSPTFIIESRYPLNKYGHGVSIFAEFVHIDAYRLDNASNLKPLHFDETFAQPNTLVLIEWPEHIASSISAHAQYMNIAINNDNTRTITLSS